MESEAIETVKCQTFNAGRADFPFLEMEKLALFMHTGTQWKYVSKADGCPTRVGKISLPYSIVRLVWVVGTVEGKKSID